VSARVQLRSLGATGLTVSRIGLGLAALGRPGYINVGHGGDLDGHTDVESMAANARATLDAAYAGGVRYFDTARSYGRAEEFLAGWLAQRALRPGDLAVGSKWGYTYTAGWRVDAEVHEVKELTLATLTRQYAESTAMLGSHLRLYQIHSATLDSGVLEDRAVGDELARLRAGGLRIGFTTSGARQAETIERALETGGFDAVQSTWNLLEPSAGEALAAAHAAGLGIIVKEALANGRLTARGDAAPLVAAAGQAGVAPDALALAAVLAQPWADVVLSGASTPEMITSNLAAVTLTPAPEVLSRLTGLAEAPDAYWDERAALRWN
jgi:aryl-alcohol dehydrogenase-like predicted oxidoreductase